MRYLFYFLGLLWFAGAIGFCNTTPLPALFSRFAEKADVLFNTTVFKTALSDTVKLPKWLSDTAVTDPTAKAVHAVEACDTIEKRPEGLELPAAIPGRREQIIAHDGYTVSHNGNWCIPNWVAYELTDEETRGKVRRNDRFIPDPQVKGRTATTQDYKGSGYDRGHMAPAADMKWSKYAMAQCFYLSNICPQNSNLNKGDWRILEEKGRIWAQTYGSIYIVCGPIVEEGHPVIGRNKVAVPQRFFKVFLRFTDSQAYGIGFLFDQKAGSKPLSYYAVSIDEAEQQSGIDFFANLPDELEQRVEAYYSLADWGF